MLAKHQNLELTGKNERPIVTDIFFNKNNKLKPIVIFCHGYKGFKDWGAWNLMAEQFASKGFFFIKFNFSHNGGTLQQPEDFPDPEAFGRDNYTKQQNDLESVIDWISTTKRFKTEVNVSQIFLIGHSLGGSMVLLKSSTNNLIKKCVAWAPVSNLKNRFPKSEKLEKWKNDGVFFIENSRTKQLLPQYYQMYEDYIKNKNLLNIRKAAKNIKFPILLIHSKEDTSVPITNSVNIATWSKNAELYTIENSNHTFDTVHPWEQNEMSTTLQKVVEKTIDFLNK